MKIYFDMDGVLADWVAAFIKKFPDIDYEKFNSLPKEDYDSIKNVIANDPNYFKNLPPMGGVWLLKKLINEGYDVEILTSCGKINTDKVADQKRAWLKEHNINVPFNYTISSEDKANYANENAILIDDRAKSINAFKNAGGKVVFYVDPLVAYGEVVDAI